MADPLSISASVLAIVTAAIQSTKTLHEAVRRFKGRDKTLGRLQKELEDMTSILNALAEVIIADEAMCSLLRDPVDRCGRLCRDFERSMEYFSGKSKASLIDWAKMEFMKGDINEFIETMSGYKETISVAVGTIIMKTSKVSSEVLEEYHEMIQNTSHSLQVHLQRIDEKLARLMGENVSASIADVYLTDEKEVTMQCIKICQDAKTYLEALRNSELSFLQDEKPLPPSENLRTSFHAMRLTRQTLDENRDSFAEIIGRLRERLELVIKGDPDSEATRQQLQEDIDISKQCLDVCKAASDQVSQRKVHTIGEVIADGDSDQIVVTTLADLFDVRKATSKGRSAQLIGSMTDETLQRLSGDRYKSRFGTNEATDVPQHGDTVSTVHFKKKNLEARGQKPSPNEMRKRMSDS